MGEGQEVMGELGGRGLDLCLAEGGGAGGNWVDGGVTCV